MEEPTEIPEEEEAEEERKIQITDEVAAEMRRLYNDDNVGYADLAKEYGVSLSYIGGIISNRAKFDENYTRTNFSTDARKLSDEDVGEIRRLYNDEKVSIAQIAEDYDITAAYVGSLVGNKYRIDKDYVRKNFQGSRRPRLTKEDVAQIRDKYNRKDVSLEKLAKQYNRDVPYIRDVVRNKKHPNKKYVQTRFEGGRKFGPKLPRKPPVIVTPEMIKMIRDGYNHYNWSYKYLSDTYGLSGSALRQMICNTTHVDPNYQQKRFS